MRREDWTEKLAESIEASRIKPFAYGQHDCVLFALGVADSLTGADLASRFKGEYSTDLGAARMIKRMAPTLADAVDTEFRRQSVELSGRGDLVLYENCLGVCDGPVSLFLQPVSGLMGVPTLDCSHSWRVD